jgi:hypothetical protein
MRAHWSAHCPRIGAAASEWAVRGFYHDVFIMRRRVAVPPSPQVAEALLPAVTQALAASLDAGV